MNRILSCRDKWYLALLLGGVFVFYLSWVLIIPFGEAPDERLRFDIPDFIAKYRALPLAGDPRLYYGGYGQTYAALPYLSYLISGILCLLAKAAGLPVAGYIVSRMVSVFSGMVTLYFAFRIAGEMFPDRITRYFLPIFLAFTPQFTFISVYTNQDSFMVMLSAVIIYLWTQGLRTNWDWRTVAGTGIACGLMMLTYINGYVLILSTLLIVLISYRGKNTLVFLRKFLLCAGIILLVSGWFFLRNAYYYHGDFLGMRTLNRIAEQKAMDGFRPSQLALSSSKWHGFAGLFFSTEFLRGSFRSFWAVLGNMSIVMNARYYVYIALICLIAVIGCSARLMEKIDAGARAVWKCKLGITFVMTALGGLAVSCYYSAYVDFQPQGRYMYPGLIAIFLLMTLGFERVFHGNARRVFYKIVVFTFVLLDIWIGYISLLPHYLIY